MSEPEEIIKKAMERYPGLPVLLAVARYLLWEKTAEEFRGDWVKPGTSWGGLHLEDLGNMVHQIAEEVYRQGKWRIVLEFEAEDFPESWDHWALEIREVE